MSANNSEIYTVERNDDCENLKTVDRIHNYPVVADSVNAALDCYKWLKSSASIIDFSLSKAEQTVSFIASTTVPYASKTLKQADNYCNTKLDSLETRFPVLLQPTGVIYEDKVKPVVGGLIRPVKVTVQATVTTATHILENNINRHIPVYVVDQTEQVFHKYILNTPANPTVNGDHQQTKSDRLYQLTLETQEQLTAYSIKQICALCVNIQQTLTTIKQHLRKMNLIQKCSYKLQDIEEPVVAQLIKFTVVLKQLTNRVLVTKTMLVRVLSKSSSEFLDELYNQLSRLEQILSDKSETYVSSNVLQKIINTVDSIKVIVQTLRKSIRNDSKLENGIIVEMKDLKIDSSADLNEFSSSDFDEEPEEINDMDSVEENQMENEEDVTVVEESIINKRNVPEAAEYNSSVKSDETFVSADKCDSDLFQREESSENSELESGDSEPELDVNDDSQSVTSL